MVDTRRGTTPGACAGATNDASSSSSTDPCTTVVPIWQCASSLWKVVARTSTTVPPASWVTSLVCTIWSGVSSCSATLVSERTCRSFVNWIATVRSSVGRAGSSQITAVEDRKYARTNRPWT